MSSSNEEEDVGPSVDSTDMEERIAARRIRIAKRAEAARKALLGEDLNEQKEVKEEISKSRKQIEDSRLRLTKLRKDGFELVSNIRVAGDAREASRRTIEEEAKRHRKEKLDLEAKSAAERFDEITKKWESALQKEVPQSLHEMLLQQKRSCDAMNDEKNKLITDFQQDLKAKDDLYVKDLKKMAEDIDLMIERMNEQVDNLGKGQREELEEIERAFVAERNELLEIQKKKWEEKMAFRREKEEENLIARAKRVEDFEQQLQHLRVQDAEEYNMVKIRLETDVQILEQQLQQMRATYQLNQEKLEYNFQVLKKRDDENTITKSQQKRKITRLQDVLNALRQKLAKQEKAYKDENSQLSEDYKRITEQFHDLQRKSKHFLATDAKKFHDIWCMNEEELKVLLKEVLEADRVIHEQQLGLPPQQADMSFLDNVGPLVNAGKTQSASATQILHEVMSSKTVASEASNEDEGVDAPATIYNKISAHTIKQILELLCDEAGFLVEQKLNKLLAPLEKDERSLMKLDNIFSALGLETEEDIHKLSMYFMNIREKSEEDPEKNGSSSELNADREMPTEEDEVEDEIRRMMGEGPVDDGGDEFGEVPSDCVDLIHPNEVLKALRAFVEDTRKGAKQAGGKAQFHLSSLEDRDDSQDSDYWNKYANFLSEKKERLWDALVDALEKYHEVLHSRSALLSETEALRQQNAELRLLLHQYVNSKVNAELEIPPTRVLQLELNPN
ncbi:dynein regulatory complex protein 1-like [Plakobranchus ocellatus]|uniref:Dynein regulatory complex protein 1-like n=1 Tax=Plakobranchus ocellatus TaxID=259542 RepID=A0AAV4B2V5_9GAST|nr:dynein regulatory complex protein 1-like [Plakobranchus ocellatus]